MGAASTRWAHTGDGFTSSEAIDSVYMLCSRWRTPTHTVRNPGSAGGFLDVLAGAGAWHCMTAGGQLSTNRYTDQNDGAHLRLPVAAFYATYGCRAHIAESVCGDATRSLDW